MGERIVLFRERRGWSKRQLANRAGLHESYIGKLERNTYHSPGSEALGKIAKALGVSLDELTAEESPPPIPLAGRIARTEDLDLPVYRSQAGRLILADPTPLEHWRIRADRTYTVEIVGDCLFGLNISEGDRLIVDREARPESGRIVVVRIGDETYLTRWKKLNGMVELEMSDGQFREALVHDLDVQGVVVNVIKPAP